MRRTPFSGHVTTCRYRFPDATSQGFRTIFLTDGSGVVIGLGSRRLGRWLAYFSDPSDDVVDFWAELSDGSVCRLARSARRWRGRKNRGTVNAPAGLF